MHTDGLLSAPLSGVTQLSGWLPRPLDRLPPSEVGPSGLTGCSLSWKNTKRWPSKSIYQDTKMLLSRQCGSRSTVPVGERLKKLIDEWVSITQEPFMLGTLHFICKAPTCEAYLPVQGKDSRDLGGCSSLRDQCNALQGHHKSWPRKQGVLLIPLYVSQKELVKPLYDEAETAEPTQKVTTLKDIREPINPGQGAVSLDITSDYCHIPIARRPRCFFRFRTGKICQFKILLFGLSTAHEYFIKSTPSVVQMHL